MQSRRAGADPGHKPQPSINDPPWIYQSALVLQGKPGTIIHLAGAYHTAQHAL